MALADPERGPQCTPSGCPFLAGGVAYEPACTLGAALSILSPAGLCWAGAGPAERGRARQWGLQKVPLCSFQGPRPPGGLWAGRPTLTIVNPFQLLPCLFVDPPLGANWAQPESKWL